MGCSAEGLPGIDALDPFSSLERVPSVEEMAAYFASLDLQNMLVALARSQVLIRETWFPYCRTVSSLAQTDGDMMRASVFFYLLMISFLWLMVFLYLSNLQRIARVKLAFCVLWRQYHCF